MMIRSKSSIWKNDKIRERLNWYYKVLLKVKPSKYLIVKEIPYDGDLDYSDTDKLITEHKRLSLEFFKTHQDISEKNIQFQKKKPKSSFLDLKIELIKRTLRKCTICEWNCNINRFDDKKKGACKLDSKSRVSTWFHHYGEEEPLVSGRGSGTIFFTGCTFRCVFCQNWDISQNQTEGTVVDGKRLSLIMKELAEEGVANINFVGGDPTPNILTILEATKQFNSNTPLLWNSNMFLTKKLMEILADIIDIWLPDLKWGNDNCALNLSKIPNYSKVIKRNLIFAQKNGDMIIRHLIIPGHIECCTKPIIKWISRNCNKAVINIMDQYRPEYLVATNRRYEEINRFPSKEEVNITHDYSNKIGVTLLP